MQRKQTVAPVNLAVSVADLKNHLRVDITDEDDLIQAYLESAIRYSEEHTRRAFISQTWQVTLNSFDSERIYLTPAPLQSVSSISYYDSSGSQQTLSSSLYQVITENTPPYVTPAVNQEYPATQLGRDSAVTITYVCGYGDDDTTVDPRAAQLVKFLAAHYYENREPVLTGTIATALPLAAQSLLYSLEIVEVV